MRRFLNNSSVPLSLAVFLATDLTQDTLKEWLHYEPTTGVFTWVKSPTHWISPGTVAGHKAKKYTQIRVNKQLHYAHRLAFLYMTGKFPAAMVDHINGDASDDSWGNLRNATALENQRNAAISGNNTSSVTGVLWDKRRLKWAARIGADYKTLHLGYFSEFSDACAARKAAEVEKGFHANHGRAAHA